MDTRKIIDSYFQYNELSNVQLESYNHLIHVVLPTIIQQQLSIPIPNSNTTIIFDFIGVHMDKPTIMNDERNECILYPQEARIRDLSYETSVFTDIQVTYIDNTSKRVQNSHVITKHCMFKLPVMVNSELCNLHYNELKGECPFDKGGYFIIKGKERVLVAQERRNYDQIYVFKEKGNKYTYLSEIRSIKPDGDYSLLLQCKLTSSDSLFYQLPYIGKDIPFGIVMKALNITSRFLKHVCSQDKKYFEILYHNLDIYKTMAHEDAIQYLANHLTIVKLDQSKRIRYIETLLKYNLIPHLGIASSTEKKGHFLILMAKKVLSVSFGNVAEDERDNISNKRVEMSGVLIGSLLHGLFKRYLKTVQQHIEKKGDVNISSALTKFNIQQRLYHCFTTGNWGMLKSSYIRQGVSQILSRLTFNAELSHLRRIVIPIGKESKNAKIRQLHPSSYGFTCAVETPEGQSSGIIKNLSLMTKVSNGFDSVIAEEIIHELLEEYYSVGYQGFDILLNGNHIGCTTEPHEFVQKFRMYRLSGWIHYSISITLKEQEICIHSDSGRILRPVIRVTPTFAKDLQEVLALPVNEIWPTCIEQGFVIYIDSIEAEYSVILMHPDEQIQDATFCEIHPTLMLGICASLIPFSNHSQAPRNIYVSSMMKQAIGVYTLNYRQRFDTIAHILHYPQKALTSTQMSNVSHMNDIPSGMNLVVAVGCYTGFNQEDSVIFNKSAVDRGLFCTTEYKSVTVSETRKGTHNTEKIEIPQPDIRKTNCDYSKLDRDGIIGVGCTVQENDILVGLVYYNNDAATTDNSVACKVSGSGVVDTIAVTTNSHGYRQVKIKLRYLRIPEIGDKFVSTAAQKGTMGMMYRQEDMPFNRDGICPDLIINAHAIPSRMTINMLMEMILGKAGSLSGELHDATPFEKTGEDIIKMVREPLLNNGFESHGNETMYNGMTGEQFQVQIFMGVCYYQRLKHLVAAKIHSRKEGNVQVLSRQPVAGRSRDGGLRFGEMERDCMITHGLSYFLKERLFDMSDPYQLNVCDDCGTMINAKDVCMECGKDHIKRINIPYACKLLFQNLQAMGIRIRLKPTE
jgi:DNA-directed RNA polymerase II subunit RPB2